MSDDWIDHFPGLQHLAPERVEALKAASRVVSLPPGSRVFGPGSAPSSFLLVLEGSIRVQQLAENGREIVVYRVNAGESCPLTTACLLGYEEYQADAIVEDAATAVTVPRAVFDALIAESGEFRRFIFAAFSRRITGLFRVIQEVAFERIDIRLAHRLLALSGGGDAVALTHQQLASELGSAREVISRQLAEFQRRGWIHSGRGRIGILQPESLRSLADS